MAKKNLVIEPRMDPFAKRLKKQVDTVARYLYEGAPTERAPILEDSLVQAAGQTSNSELRSGLSELYRTGYFGQRDVVNGYVWTLAAWNGDDGSYDEKFALAEMQQYYEFFLSADEKSKAKRILKQVLPSGEPCHFVAGNPFNSNWWGWEDDPIPARPGERDFKAGFVQWLQYGGYAESEIAGIMALCPPSDGPTRMEKRQRAAEEMMRGLGFPPAEAKGKGKPGQ